MSSGAISVAVTDLGGQSADDAVSDFFAAVEREMEWTLAMLAGFSSIPHDTLKDYRRGKSKPGFEALRKLIAVTPSHIGSILLNGTGRTIGASNPQSVEDKRLATLAAKATAQLTEALEDGFVDHRERRRIIPAARELRDAADGFIRKAEGE